MQIITHLNETLKIRNECYSSYFSRIQRVELDIRIYMCASKPNSIVINYLCYQLFTKNIKGRKNKNCYHFRGRIKIFAY